MQEKTQTINRGPVIAIMGHVDHGKSTLLDYIRKTNVVDSEAGGITQKISAYEVVHKDKTGADHKITFLDTPGHEAFKNIRTRGASAADIAVIVVSAEDGVRPQTLEALNAAKSAKIPFIIAINKIDKESADIIRTKNSLAENDVYVEGYGGTVSCVEISAKTGKGIPELLDMMLLQAELEDLRGNPHVPATGIIIEANLDKKKGISATLVIKNGVLKSGEYVVAGTSLSPVRIMENFLGKNIKEATFPSPVRIIGWNELPIVGTLFTTLISKKEAEILVEKNLLEKKSGKKEKIGEEDERFIIPIVLKASEVGSLEALLHEIAKVPSEKIKIKIIGQGVGDISENDVKLASGRANTIVLGFNVKVDAPAASHAEKTGVIVQTFDIIYKLSEWLQNIALERTPKVMVDEATGTAKVLKFFSKAKDRQIIGCRMEKGEIKLGAEVKIMRRDFEVGRGRVRELQKQKNKVGEIQEGQEFGTMIESKTEIAPGDKLEAFTTVEK